MESKAIYTVSHVKLSCHRWTKYPEDDRRRICKFGFAEIRDACFDCKWRTAELIKTYAASGPDAENVARFLRTMMPKEILKQSGPEDRAADSGGIRLDERLSPRAQEERDGLH